MLLFRPPSLESLEAQLRGRGTEREEDIRKRLAQARREFEFAERGVHDRVIVNYDLDRAYKELEGFVFGSTGRPAG